MEKMGRSATNDCEWSHRSSEFSGRGYDFFVAEPAANEQDEQTAVDAVGLTVAIFIAPMASDTCPSHGRGGPARPRSVKTLGGKGRLETLHVAENRDGNLRAAGHVRFGVGGRGVRQEMDRRRAGTAIRGVVLIEPVPGGRSSSSAAIKVARSATA